MRALTPREYRHAGLPAFLTHERLISTMALPWEHGARQPFLDRTDPSDVRREAVALPLAPGRVTVLRPTSFPVSLALARAALAPGGEVRAVVVDGGNRFDPSALARWAQHLGAPPRRVLEAVAVSRAFTCHQLARLVTERLPRELAVTGARLVAVLSLTSSFTDVPAREGVALFRRTLDALARAVRYANAACLVTLDREPEGYLERLARRRAVACAELLPGLRLQLEGGPAVPLGATPAPFPWAVGGA